ncbi:MAG: cache domain-containing protein [Ktedonobacterales bacterium]
MFPRWRLGIRLQLTIIVILGTVLTTVATLFIADNAIRNYVLAQAQAQESDNSQIALLVLHNNYGANISISADGKLVADSPTSFNGINVSLTSPTYGTFPLNGDTDYVDSVKHLINADVSLYQCANNTNVFTGCIRVASTFIKPGTTNIRDTGELLPETVSKGMQLASTTPQPTLGNDSESNIDYYAYYTPIFNGQNQLIAVLCIEVPLNTINSLINRTTVELILIGSVIMVAGMIFALFFANTIITTLQRAARQVNTASERIGNIAVQQSSGAAQQVWAINAINQALQNFSDTAKDISQRTDQLALMGNQVLQRRAEIPPSQIDSILAYMTRSVRDISGSTRQQAAQYERMTGAMQAVIEIAEQVAGNSQQSTESAERLELVVRQLQQVVGMRLARGRGTNDALGIDSARELGRSPARQEKAKGTVHSVRPGGRRTDEPAAALGTGGTLPGLDQVPMGQMGAPGPAMGNMGMMPQQAPRSSRGLGADWGAMPQQMPGMSQAYGMGGRRMSAPGDRRMPGGMMNFDPGPNSMQSGNLGSGQLRGDMGPGYAGSTYAGPGNPAGAFRVEDWRLPPLPDLDPPPGWEDMRGQGYSSLPPQDQMGNSAPHSGQPRPLLPPQRTSGRGNNSGPDRSNQNSGGWTR